MSDDPSSLLADTGGPLDPFARVAPATTASSLRITVPLGPRPQRAEVVADMEAFVSALLSPSPR